MLTVDLGMMLCLPLRLINYRDCDGLSWLMIVNSPNHHVSEGWSAELVLYVALCGFLACAFNLRKNCLTFVKLLECVLYILFYIILQLWVQNTDITSTAGYDNIIQHLNDGKRTCKEIEDFMKARWDATDSHDLVWHFYLKLLRVSHV